MTVIGKKLKPSELADCYDVVFIGSGMSALTCAAILSSLGKRVCILEQHYTLGGLTHAFKRKQFTWDVGLHYIGEVHDEKSLHYKLFDFISGGKLRWQSLGEVTEFVKIGSKSFTLPAGESHLRGALVDKFPQEAEGIDTYLSLIKNIFKGSPLYFINRLLPSPLSSLLSPFMGRSFKKYLDQTTREVLDELFHDDDLKALLCSFYADYNLPPHLAPFSVHACVAAHYLEGSSYPVGGSSQIAQHTLNQIEKNNGQAFTLASVESIIIERNKAKGVKLQNGQTIKAEMVVSSCGVNTTFKHLIKEKLNHHYGFENLKASTSFFSLYIGLDDNFDKNLLPKENLWIHPSANLRENWENHEELPYYFISFPSRRDPLQVTHHTISILAMYDYSRVAKWDGTRPRQRDQEYRDLKAKLSKDCLEALEKEIPGVAKHIIHSEAATPLTNKFYSNNEEGEPYGLSPDRERFLCQDLKPKTKIKNLYLTGVDITMGGVAPAMSAGLLTALSIAPLATAKLLHEKL